MYALEIKDLCKSFGELQAIHDVSLSVEVGERRAVIGPNGAGKTTLFNLLTGLLTPNSGQVYIFGRDVTDFPAHRRAAMGLARTFQVTSLLSNLTVLDNIQLAIQAHKPFRFNMLRPQRSYGDLRHDAQVLLEQWNLWDKRDTLVRNLSYGEQRIIELVMALASKPRLMLLDEPTAGMTLAETALIMEVLRGFERNLTVLLIAHDMDLVFGLDIDYITVLHYGQIVTEGRPEVIRADPKVREIYLGMEEVEGAATG